MRILRHT